MPDWTASKCLKYWKVSNFSNDFYSILVTDLKRVWKSVMTIEEFVKETKLQLPLFAYSEPEKLLDFIKNILKTPEQENIELNNRKLEISVSGKVATLSFTWIFKCEELDSADASEWIYANCLDPLLKLGIQKTRQIEFLKDIIARQQEELDIHRDIIQLHGCKSLKSKPIPKADDYKYTPVELNDPKIMEEALKEGSTLCATQILKVETKASCVILQSKETTVQNNATKNVLENQEKLKTKKRRFM